MSQDERKLKIGFGHRMAGIVMVLFIAFVAYWGIYGLQPPKTVPADAPLDVFSSGRAMEHLKVIAAQPHPMGSSENREVRDYLVRTMKALGVEPEIQKTEIVWSRSVKTIRAGTVENILVRLRGTDNTKAVLLMSHYDTVPNAPGATDDGSGVVAMLETMRALKTLPPLINDIIFLFTDGEEVGLLGARAFVRQHPWAKDVGVVLNFEGTGSKGPSLMFEMSDENGWLIEEFAKAVPYPVANSLSYEVYKRMPNDTDFSPFKRASISGFNFSYIDDRYDYHTANDNLDHIDERSVQHHGTYALSLVRHLGNVNLEENRGRNSVYFNSVGFGFVHYSEKWVIPLAVFTVVCFTALTLLGFHVKQLNILGILFGFAGFLVHLIISPVIVTCIYRIIQKFYPGTDWWLLCYQHKSLLLGFVCLTIAISVTFYHLLMKGIRIWHIVILIAGINLLSKFGGLFQWRFFLISIVASVLIYFMFRKGRGVWDLTMGSLFGWAALMAMGSIIIPGASYILTWPLLFSIIPMGLLFARGTNAHLSVLFMGLFTVFAIPVLYWYSNFAYLYFIAMGLDATGIAMIIVVLAMGLLVPHGHYIRKIDRGIFPGLVFLAAVVFVLLGTMGARFDERFRKPSSLFYGTVADGAESFWASTDREPDAWNSVYLSDEPDTTTWSEWIPGAERKIWTGGAPPSNLLPPDISILEDGVRDDLRTLSLRVVSQRAAPILYMFLPPEVEIVGVNLNGEEIQGFDRLKKGRKKDGGNGCTIHCRKKVSFSP